MVARLHLRPADAASEGSRRLREILLRRTQQDVAIVTKIAPGTIGQYARDERRPEPPKRDVLEQELGIPAGSWDHVNEREQTGEPPTVTRRPSSPARSTEGARGGSSVGDAERGTLSPSEVARNQHGGALPEADHHAAGGTGEDEVLATIRAAMGAIPKRRATSEAAEELAMEVLDCIGLDRLCEALGRRVTGDRSMRMDMAVRLESELHDRLAAALDALGVTGTVEDETR